ncbi:MAG: aspartyl/asparaginyl beta-hydroxylase domain-containing protein [Alphaproteobacteria bacterium]|nr:aspartyl/asparaginyl beta-hydroxylase domain-containing protein [Alphaproteobacteria bacterium]MBL7098327.1 aspartyl/asparaginyl beta-hydroxylase domain-containing protein [Alphaproteobacteria bacterium]
MTLPDRVRLPMSFDPAGLQRDLLALAADGWIRHFVPQNYEGDWSVLPLRGAAGKSHPIMMIYPDPTAKAFADTPAMALCPHCRSAIAAFACEVQYARLMRLAPGSRILEHRDHDLDADAGTARLHIPITTNPDVTFELNRLPVPMEPGSVWYLRLSDPHRVVNDGTTDRVHLVLDLTVNAWLHDLLAKAAAGHAFAG